MGKIGSSNVWFTLFGAFAAALLAASPAGADTRKLFPMKSAIVEMTTDLAKGLKTTIYVDDFGARQASYSVLELIPGNAKFRSEKVEIRTPGQLVAYDLTEKKGTRSKLTRVESSFPSVPDAAGMDQPTRARVKFQELPDREILGKPCKGFGLVMTNIPLKAWMWNGIPMLLETYHAGPGKPPSVTRVTSIQADVPVPAAKFEVPAGIAITDR